MRNDGRFEAIVESAAISGEVVIEIGEESLFFISMLDITELSYGEIGAFYMEGFGVVLSTKGGKVLISRLGNDQEVFYRELWKAYNALTERALFTDGPLYFEAKGEYVYSDMGGEASGEAVIRLYENALLLLPPNAGARRISLHFIKSAEMKDYALSILLDTDETYRISKIGLQAGSLHRLLSERLEGIGRQAADIVKRLDPLCPPPKWGKRPAYSKGGGVLLSQLEGVALLVKSRPGEHRKEPGGEALCFFEELWGKEGVYLGMMPPLKRSGAEAGDDREEGEDKDFLLWSAGVSQRGAAAVELAVDEGEAAATYVYRFKGGPKVFMNVLIHGMEAVSYEREVISLPEEKLAQSDYMLYAMAAERIPCLRLLRNCFAGRVIHHSPDSWKSSLLRQMN